MHEVACLLITIPFSSFPVILPFFALPRAFPPARSRNPKDASWSALSKTYPSPSVSPKNALPADACHAIHSLPDRAPLRTFERAFFPREHMYPLLRFPAYPLDANMDRTLLVGNWLWIAYVGCLCWLGWRWSCVSGTDWRPVLRICCVRRKEERKN